MMPTQKPTITSLKLTAAILFTALVCVITLSFTVSVPVTGGYFNLGEAVIFTAALTFGPIVGALAGGVGAAIADIIVAPVFAPGTLIIKGIEGALVGFLGKKLITKTSKANWRIYTALLGITVGILLTATGVSYYSGNVALYVGIPPPPEPTFTIFIPTEIWYLLGGASALLIIFASFKIEPQLGWTIFSTITGGLAMVIGYFLYEQVVLGKTSAIFEIPFNIGQMLIGLIIAIPVAGFILRTFPQLKS